VRLHEPDGYELRSAVPSGAIGKVTPPGLAS